jgi:hypothetical protein
VAFNLIRDSLRLSRLWEAKFHKLSRMEIQPNVGLQKAQPNLLTVEAERFIAALTRDRFDYTEWRKTGLPDLDIETLSAQAAHYSNTLDH